MDGGGGGVRGVKVMQIKTKRWTQCNKGKWRGETMELATAEEEEVEVTDLHASPSLQ